MEIDSDKVILWQYEHRRIQAAHGRLLKALVHISNMDNDCGGGMGESCCGCISSAIWAAEEAIEKETLK